MTLILLSMQNKKFYHINLGLATNAQKQFYDPNNFIFKKKSHSAQNSFKVNQVATKIFL